MSLKEFLIKKLEPGEDERALSQVISGAISPRRSPADMGMVGKVKEVVLHGFGVSQPHQRLRTLQQLLCRRHQHAFPSLMMFTKVMLLFLSSFLPSILLRECLFV